MITARTFERENTNTSGGKNFLILLVLSIIIVYFACHAIDKHGDKGEAVLNCLQSNGSILQLENKDNGRIAKVCLITYGKYIGKFGIRILNENEEGITAFIKEKLDTLEKVIRYLNNTGYYGG